MATATDDPLAHQRFFMAAVHRACGTPAGRAGMRAALVDPIRGLEWVAPVLPERITRDVETAYLTVAGMYAAQAPNPRADGPAPMPTGFREPQDGDRWRNLGWSMAQAVDRGVMRRETAGDRVMLLARMDRSGLCEALPPLVAHLRANEVPITWPLLLRDLSGWNEWGQDTGRYWARSFYQNANPEKPEADGTPRTAEGEVAE